MMAQREELTQVQVMQCEFCEYHKALFGFFPRTETVEQWESAAWLAEQMDTLREYQIKRIKEIAAETAE